MKNNLKKLTVILLVLLMATVILAGCKASERSDSDITAAGSLLLSINPEIRIEYDENGNVLSVKGVNKDGIALITDENEFNGQSCKEAVKLLVSRIYDAGYFVDEIEGKSKNIVIQIEDGSGYPTEHFLDDIKENIKSEIDRLGLDSSPVTVDASDHDEFGRISLEKAAEIALAQLGLNKDDVIITQNEFDAEDNCYELELASDSFEYDVDVHAENGKVLEATLEVRNDPEPVTPDKPLTPEEAPAPDGVPSDIITEDDAKKAALEYAGLTEAEYISCKLSDERDEYDVEIIHEGVEYDIEIDAYTGKVTDFDTEKDDSQPVTPSVPDSPVVPPESTDPLPERITADDAKAIALQRAGIDTPDRIFCEEDDGNYDIEFVYGNKEYEVEVDASSGKITEYDEEYIDFDD